jgi:hypothetical protein
MSITLRVFSNMHIKNEVANVKCGEWIVLENSVSRMRWRSYFKKQNIDEESLNITYITAEEYFNLSMKFGVVVGNPPYNDGSAGRAPIYDKFLEKLVQLDPEKVCFIIPTNWFSQNHNKLGKSVRSSLKTLGVYKIVLNPVTLFSGVTVGTCTAFCVKDYVGKVELENGETGEIIEINNFDEQILTEFNPISFGLLNRLKPSSPPVTYGGTDKADKWRIMTSYRKERFDLEPLNVLKVIEPNYKSQGGYRMFTYFDTEDQALEHVEYYRSFWHSKLIKFIMRRTRTSTTLDNPQLRWVPVPKKIDHVFTDEELYLTFSLTQDEIKVIEDEAAKYN